jgi:hypothetical protein
MSGQTCFTVIPRWARPYRKALYTALSDQLRDATVAEAKNPHLKIDQPVSLLCKQIDEAAGIAPQ